MIDVEEFEAYEEWKLKKLSDHANTSVQAFNLEMASLALAFEEGVDAGVTLMQSDNGVTESAINRLKANSQFRKPGMTGHTP